MECLQGNNYFDQVLDYAAGVLEPYADLFMEIGQGNHETSTLKYHQINMTEQLVAKLNERTGSKICVGGYGGWILFRMRRGKQRQTFKLMRHHGFGGSARMSKGVLDSVRMAADYPDADIVVMGHKHTEYILPVPRNRVTQSGRLFKDEQLHLRVPGYKQSPVDLYEGWEVERGFAPTTNGCMAIELGWENFKGTQRFVCEPERWR
jgi:hypothetical protein